MRERRADGEANGLNAPDDGPTDTKADCLGRADAVLRVRAGAHAYGRHWYEATNVCAAEGKVLCGVDKPCSRSGCSYDNHYQWTGEECQAGDAGLPAAC